MANLELLWEKVKRDEIRPHETSSLFQGTFFAVWSRLFIRETNCEQFVQSKFSSSYWLSSTESMLMSFESSPSYSEISHSHDRSNRINFEKFTSLHQYYTSMSVQRLARIFSLTLPVSMDRLHRTDAHLHGVFFIDTRRINAGMMYWNIPSCH